MNRLFVIFSILFFTSSVPCYAYLDPATGSLILQVIIGAVASVMAFSSRSWKKVKSIFKKKETKSPESK